METLFAAASFSNSSQVAGGMPSEARALSGIVFHDGDLRATKPPFAPSYTTLIAPSMYPGSKRIIPLYQKVERHPRAIPRCTRARLVPMR